MKFTFEYGLAQVKDLQVIESMRSTTGRLHIKAMAIEGRRVLPTKRFWKSFFARFFVTECVFRYFEPAEVFDRISERASDDTLRFCLEHRQKGDPRLLAVTNPGRPVIRHGEVTDLTRRHGGTELDYADGVVTSTHTLRGGGRPFKIGADAFEHRFVMETPIDGYGHPKIYLSFLRQICSNGMIGYAKAFRSDISLGKDIAHCIGRALDGFDNGEGYAALRQRIESAQQSWASVRECGELYKYLADMNDGNSLQADRWLGDFRRMTGNLNSLYGLANLDAISLKRQRVLPTRCRVYDLLNFASEMATHRASAVASRRLQGFIGSIISDEYDMEGTAQSVTDFADFFLQN